MSNRNVLEQLTPQTDAGTSGAFSADRGNLPITFIGGNLTLALEKVTIQIWNGQAFEDLYVNSVLQEVEFQVNTAVTVYGPGVYRGVKSVTDVAAGIYVCPAGQL